MQLLDLADHLPGLPRLPGLKKWYARDKVQYYETWEEASEVHFYQPKISFHLVTFTVVIYHGKCMLVALRSHLVAYSSNELSPGLSWASVHHLVTIPAPKTVAFC